jgi:sarcosine oxidase subunit gamma
MQTIDPTQFARRSLVYRRLVAAGAMFMEVDGAAVAANFPGRGGLPARLALVDLSPLPRLGFKGPQALPWLREQGAAVPDRNNSARLQPDGALVARLGDTEALVLPDLALRDPLLPRLGTAGLSAGCYRVPRRDSHAWFILCGDRAVPCLGKLCGLDLRAHATADLDVAQTLVARISAIVVRQNQADVPAFHLLADSASALYLWDALTDAMAEFHGAPAGLQGLRALSGDKIQ